MQPSLQNIKSHYLYNMLQDYRHLLIFDLRSQQQFIKVHIRDAFNLHPEITQQQIKQVLSLALKKNEQKEQKYKDLKKVRRYFFIDSESFTLNAPDVANRVKIVLENIPKDPSNKIYGLSDKFQQYSQKYHFTCLEKLKFDQLRDQGADQKQLQKVLVYPYCRFPTQIITDKLYLGNIYSSNSQKQLDDIGIKNLVDFIDYQSIEQSDKMIPSFKTDNIKYSYLSVPFNKDVQVAIDFDNIFKQISLKANEAKTLLYCRDGETISAALTIGYLMYTANLDVTMATLKVCQAIGRSDINKWIYTQLLVYKPKK